MSARRDPFAWCPETVRHVFRRARFGLCAHGVTLYRVGDIAWAGACGLRNCEEAIFAVGAIFAIGHHLEVPERSEPLEPEHPLFGLLASAVPTTRERVIRAVPREHVVLAEDLGVTDWGAAQPRENVWAAIGGALGLPVCVIAPLLPFAQDLDPARELADGRWVR